MNDFADNVAEARDNKHKVKDSAKDWNNADNRKGNSTEHSDLVNACALRFENLAANETAKQDCGDGNTTQESDN